MGNSRETPAIQPTPLSQRAGIKKRNYEEYKKYKKEDEGGRLCRRGCIDLAEQSRDALGTLAAAVFFPELNMSRENQIPGIPTYNLLGDHQTGNAGENAKESVTATLSWIWTWAVRRERRGALQSVLCQSS